MKRLALLLILMVSCTSVSYEEHTDAGSKYVLSNGLTIVMRENHDTGMAAIDVLIRRGLASEGEMHGINNFVNRMLLAGTEKRSREDIAREIEEVGGSITARTYAEYSEIIVEVPSESTSTALTVLADVLLHPAFKPEEVERERTLIIGDLSSKKDQPNVRSEELFMNHMYAGHPYANPIDGYEETIKNITRDDLVHAYQKWYTPNNMVVGIAGNVRERAMVNAIRSLFGGLDTKGPTEEVPEPSVHTTEDSAQQNMALESFYIQQGYQLVPARDPDFIKLRMANAILGAGSGSRLFYELRDKRALAYSVYSIAPSIRTTGFVKIAMISRPAVVNESISGIMEQIDRIKTEDVPADELQVVKQKVRGFFALDHQKTADQANYLALYELQGLGYHYDVEYPDKISKVTAEDVKMVSNKYFNNPVVTIVGPFKQGEIS